MAKIAKKTSPKASSKASSASSISASHGGASQDGENKIFLLTQDGYDKLVTELDYLRNVKRREVAERIREAISYGDLSENSEYEDAKNDQAFVEGRIMELEEKVKYVKIIDEAQSRRVASVQLGSSVAVRFLGHKGSPAKDMKFIIVGSTEADPLNGKISNVSPVGMALLDHRAGETIDIHTPSGVSQYEIIKVM